MVIKRTKQKQISFGYCDISTGQRVYPPMSDDLLPEQQPPELEPPARTRTPDNDDMYLKLTCWPPLGQPLTVSRHEHSVHFTVLMETMNSKVADQEEPQIFLWHNHNGDSDWTELQFHPIPERTDVLLVNRSDGAETNRRWYTAELTGLPKHGQVVNFTVKYHVDEARGWRWIKDNTGVEDGELHYQTHDFTKHSAHDVKHWFDGMSSEIKAETEKAETDDTLLYSLTCPVNAADGQTSGWQHHQLGFPSNSSRWFSLVRLWSPWLAPRQGKGKLSLDKDAVLLSFLRSDGLHVVVLGISGVDDTMTTFFNDSHGNVVIKGRNDSTETGTSRVLVAVADSFEVANAAVFYHARKVVGSYSTSESDKEISTMVDDVKPEWLQEWYDGLTYCTWNGLGQNLTEKKILDALEDLSSNNINITNLIIDDNWQSLSSADSQFQRGWSDFDANKEGFPRGLKATTTEIRSKHKTIRHIGVWHALLGYWGGIDPSGWIAKNYKTAVVEKEKGVAEGSFTVVAASDAARMYDDFYAFLSSAGVDAVKTDAQFFLDMLEHAPDRRAMMKEYQSAWTTAHLRHLSSRAISCMSQIPQIIFHSQLPKNKPRLLVRNSDDFFPEVPASHPWHIFCNAHNALLAQHLNVLPDWDMFQTSHPWAGFHAAARCVSGGPIYFTDTPGEHDLDLLQQISATTTRGKTVILRPHIVGKATTAYNAYSAQNLLKISTYVGFARTGTGILGVFNLSEQETLSEFIPLDQFPGTEEGEYVLASYRSGKFSSPVARKSLEAEKNGEKKRDPLMAIDLPPASWDILTASPVKTFTLPHRDKTPLSVSLLGLRGKMTGIAAVSGCDMYVEDGSGRLRIWVQLKALGVLAFWIGADGWKGRTVEDDLMVLLYGKPLAKGCVGVKEADGSAVLEVDIAKAWKESGETPGWGDEVSLEVFIR
ncbi:unnamed protein product [Zymoseptoria tritici ST99CH_1A5]|uniref:Uncharacterized protein n=2 Tax=Zymoseptoria tritici TaxID=1047171 RepID=A0A2H1GG68_ZYMTR|nr:unnamed protein product [Zymoseptoria tritici ST99CH_1E4]SMY24348.1 unnamed protein product [Zymoseptoria tritici ST99CH_1A5]